MSNFDNITYDTTNSSRFMKKENTIGARDMYANLWAEAINLYGVGVNFYVHGYTTDTHDFIYGTDPTAPFHEPKELVLLPEYQNDAFILSKFGIESTADIIAMIPIVDFQNKYGIGAEPKSGDVIELYESAWETSELPIYESSTGAVTGLDAKTLLCQYKDNSKVAEIAISLEELYGYKYVRHPQLFEITEVKYQDYSQQGMNALQGHYVWKIEAKRFTYSFEPNIDGEAPPQAVYDNTFFGQLATLGNTPTAVKSYDNEVDVEGNEKVWDYDETQTDTKDYGYY